MPASATPLKLFGNLKWTPESSNQIDTKPCVMLLIIVL